VYREFLCPKEQAELVSSLERSRGFRQYKFGNVPEPRVHMLLASGVGSSNVSYRYHGVTMVARDVSSEPAVADLARKTSAAFEDADWNVGVDVVCYRDGQDSVGWHADDTQGETLVVAAVLESVGGPRRIQFRPKQPRKKASTKMRVVTPSPQKKKRKTSSCHVGEAVVEDGDEEVELWICQGDAYAMDRGVQVHYEHAVPKRSLREGPLEGRRIVAIMRQGEVKLEASAEADSGFPVSSLKAPLRRCERTEAQLYGHPDPRLIEEAVDSQGRLDDASSSGKKRVYSREEIVFAGAHASAQRGVAGIGARGAESLVVSRQTPALRERDGLTWLRYTSTRRQGASSLFQSMSRRKPIRVFRSSNLASPFAPKAKTDTAAGYRYDGLYNVVAAWNADGGPPTLAAPPPPSSTTPKKKKKATSVLGHHLHHKEGELGAAPGQFFVADPVYTFRLARVDGAPNACANSVFREALVAGKPEASRPPAFDDVEALPQLVATAVGLASEDAADAADLKETRTICAEALFELVDIVDADAAGAFDPNQAPPAVLKPPKKRQKRKRDEDAGAGGDDADAARADRESRDLVDAANVEQQRCYAASFEAWLANRKLYWRFSRLAPGREPNNNNSNGVISSSSGAPPQVLLREGGTTTPLHAREGSSKDAVLATMVAAAAARSVERSVAEAIAAQAPEADVEVFGDDDVGPKCDLCGLAGSSHDDEELGELRAFVKASGDHKKPVTVHEACAISASEVFAEDRDWYHVVDAVRRGRSMKCAADKKCRCRPKKSGATVGCAVAKCRRTYHYLCARGTNWAFGPNNMFFWCEKHRQMDYDPDDPPLSEQEEEEEELDDDDEEQTPDIVDDAK